MHSLLLVAAALSASAAQTGNPQAGEFQGVLLEFSATWCGPCQQIKPLVQRLQRQGYPIRQVDVDREKAIARKYNISSIPAFVLVINGKAVSRSVGGQSEAALKRLMAKIPRGTADENIQLASRTAPAQATAGDPPRRGLLPRITLPVFDSKPESPAPGAGGGNDIVVRGNNEEPPTAAESAASRIDPLASSTRIQIKDSEGINYGSGTIIHSAPGRAIVLTCGHIFRNLSKEALIEVDVFFGDEAKTYLGTLLRYDLEADVGLISINSDVVLPRSYVASADTHLSPNEPVFSIGCGGGEAPSRQNIRVTRLNPYLGPDNVECTGVPIQGRSGGGLFNQQGEIVGVCVAADPKKKRGLYAGLKAILNLLNEDQSRPADQAPADTVPFVAASESPAVSEARPDKTPFGHSAEPADELPPIDAADAADAADLDALATAQAAGVTLPADAEGAEVICIIRSHDDPRASSRVVIINRASPKFLAYLRGDVQRQPQPTSGRIERRQSRPMTTSRANHPSAAAGNLPVPDPNAWNEPVDGEVKPASARPSRWHTAGGLSLRPARADSAAKPERYRRSPGSRR